VLPECERCGCDAHEFERLPPAYVYLLGLYLGDGCLATHPRGVYRLRIVLDTKYPGIIESAAAAMREIRPGDVGILKRRNQNCVEVYAYWKQWRCYLPQHGVGRKHDRRIAFSDWQLVLAERWPEQLLRGLIHSDGYRYLNSGRKWLWPRYGFSNRSADIRSIFCHACDQMELHWTKAGKYTIYVSRKADVATLDTFIGPKR
jgi:hypothetical protein